MNLNLKDRFMGGMEKSPKYQDYYEFVKQTVDGKYVYMGPIFDYAETNPVPKKKYMTLMVVCALLMAVLTVWSGTLYISGMNSRWQVGPYGLELLFAYATAWGVIRLAFTKTPMKIFEYRPTLMKIPGRAKLTVYISAIGFACMGIYVFMNGWNGRVLNTVLYMAARLVVGLSAGLIYKLSMDNEWTQTETNESLN